MIENNDAINDLVSAEFKKRASARAKEFKHTVGWPVFDEKEIIAALDSLLDLNLSQGKKVSEFEKKYSDYLGLPDGSGGIAVNSGSSANLICFASLIQAGLLSHGDEVIVPAATFATVSSPLYQLGLVPVYVDSDLDTFNLDPTQIALGLSPKTKAIFVVHNLGFPAEMDQIMQIAKANDLLVIEDCCEAHGGFYKGKQLGSIGHMATLSFFVAHNITTGEGGMVFYKDAELEKIIRGKREFGRSINPSQRYEKHEKLGEYDTRYVFESLGYNVRMTDFVAAIGIVQLDKLEKLNSIRRENAQRFIEILRPYSEFINSLTVSDDSMPGYYGFPILMTPSCQISRNDFCRKLEEYNIETRPNMGGCLPDQPGFKNEQHRIVGDLSNARFIRDNALFIGVHSELTEAHFSNFSNALKSIFTKG